jgi:hypothetical protein
MRLKIWIRFIIIKLFIAYNNGNNNSKERYVQCLHDSLVFGMIYPALSRSNSRAFFIFLGPANKHSHSTEIKLN